MNPENTEPYVNRTYDPNTQALRNFLHNKVTWLVGGVVLVLCLALAVFGHNQGSQGFHNMNTLAQSWKQSQQAWEDGPDGNGQTIVSATCVSITSTTATCNAQFADGSGASQTVTISPDGQTWVSQ